MITSFDLLDSYTDLWGSTVARLVQKLGPLAYNSCFLPHWYVAPDPAAQIVGPDGYVQASLFITPGSFIWGLLLEANFSGALTLLQVTDVTLKHKWFSDPVPTFFFQKEAGDGSAVGHHAFLLEAPYPVVGSGIFMVEFWNPGQLVPVRCGITFGVAESRCS